MITDCSRSPVAADDGSPRSTLPPSGAASYLSAPVRNRGRRTRCVEGGFSRNNGGAITPGYGNTYLSAASSAVLEATRTCALVAPPASMRTQDPRIRRPTALSAVLNRKFPRQS